MGDCDRGKLPEPDIFQEQPVSQYPGVAQRAGDERTERLRPQSDVEDSVWILYSEITHHSPFAYMSQHFLRMR